MVDAGRRADRRQHRLDLLRVDAAVEQRNILMLARQYMVHHETIEEAVLEIVQRVLEDDALRGAVAIDEDEAAVLLARQYRAQNRHYRRNARARGDREISARGFRVG